MPRHGDVKADRRRHAIICTHPILRELSSLGLPDLANLAGTRRTLLPSPESDDAARNLAVIGRGSASTAASSESRASATALPEEVVLQIFGLVVDPESPRSVFRLAGICRHWRDYAINYSRLWTNIKIGTTYSLEHIGPGVGLPTHIQERMRHRSLYMLQLQLERSRRSLLSIRIRCILWSGHIQMLASTLAIHQSRWKSLSLESEWDTDINNFFTSCNGPTNQLESLSVRVGSHIEPKSFSGTLLVQGLFPCPALQTTSFTHCFPIFPQDVVPWHIGQRRGSRPFPNVTRLEVTFPPITAQGDHWHLLLCALPQLEEFHLAISDVPRRLQTSGFTSYPTVRHFSIDASARALCILHHFSFSRLKTFTLNFPLLQLRNARRARSALYNFLEGNGSPHLVIKWPQSIHRDNVADTTVAFEEVCSAVFSSSGLEHLTIEMQGTDGPWMQLLKYMDGLTPEIASSLGAADLRRLEIVFKNARPWLAEPWIPVEELGQLSSVFPAWETVLHGEAGEEELFALWVAVEEPTRYFSEFSLAKWMMA